MNSPPPRFRLRPWPHLALVGLAIVAGLAAAWLLRSTPRVVFPAAYVMATGDFSRVKFGWRTLRLSTTRSVALPSGREVKIPAQSTVKIIHLDGRVETVSGPSTLRFDEKPPSEVDTLRSPLREVVDAAKTSEALSAPGLRITSPAGVTRFLNPSIAWIARDGALYDVVVADPADPSAPIRIARGMRPPVAVADLETKQKRELVPDRIYEAAVRETGTTDRVGATRFLTLPDATATDILPNDPTELLLEAVRAMAKKPTRTGDAWLALSRLPADWADSELAVRLRLRVAAELGVAEELTRAQQAAERLMKN